MSETSLILSTLGKLPVFSFNDGAKELKAVALDGAALIGRVRNAADNELAVKAQRSLKEVIALFEKERKRLKEPLLEAGRDLDRTVAAESDELEREHGRITALVSEFQREEQRRVQEERRIQQAEIDRIEREKQAELKRIADEKAAQEAEAAKIKDAAAREARLQQIAATQRQAVIAVEDKAADRTYVESRPIAATRVAGQSVRDDWEIQVVNPYELAKFHPDCVEITPRLSEIKRHLNAGLTIKGIKAEKKLTASVRLAPERKAIEV